MNLVSWTKVGSLLLPVNALLTTLVFSAIHGQLHDDAPATLQVDCKPVEKASMRQLSSLTTGKLTPRTRDIGKACFSYG